MCAHGGRGGALGAWGRWEKKALYDAMMGQWMQKE